MDWFAPTMLPIVLLFFGGVNYFGVRRDRPPVSILAMLAGVVLLGWGGVYMMDLARFWSGRPREQTVIGIEVYAALLFTFVKLRTWLEYETTPYRRRPRRVSLGRRAHGA